MLTPPVPTSRESGRRVGPFFAREGVFEEATAELRQEEAGHMMIQGTVFQAEGTLPLRS